MIRDNNLLFSPLSELYIPVLDESVSVSDALKLLAWTCLNFGANTVNMPFIAHNGKLFTVKGCALFYLSVNIKIEESDFPPDEIGEILRRFFPWRDANEYPSDELLEHELKYEYTFPLNYVFENEYSFDIYPGSFYVQLAIYYWRLIHANRFLIEHISEYKENPGPETYSGLVRAKAIRNSIVKDIYNWIYRKRLS